MKDVLIELQHLRDIHARAGNEHSFKVLDKQIKRIKKIHKFKS